MMDIHYNIKGLSKQSFSVSRYCNHSRNSIELRAHSLHGAELNQSLEQSKNRDCLRTGPRRVTDAFLFEISFFAVGIL